MFKKVLIANRGEIALRVIRTCREMGIKTVAVYSTADRDSLHVKFADEAVCIGKPQSSDSYLNIAHIMAAAEITNADAIHPGYGFLAENSKFAKICNDHGIKFIGPTPDMINSMGDKITAKETMIKAGVPVVPGGEGLLQSVDEAKGLAKNMGYPVILKATAGGGGKGMRIVWEESEIEKAYDTAKAEAAASFKNDGIYMEKFVEEPRHIEIQVAGDQFGTVCHLSERDCSIQRRHQKLIEESPSPFMTDELRYDMGEAAKKAAQAINYESVGTIEFLVDKHRNFYFMEMNTRIQVEHCVTGCRARGASRGEPRSLHPAAAGRLHPGLPRRRRARGRSRHHKCGAGGRGRPGAISAGRRSCRSMSRSGPPPRSSTPSAMASSTSWPGCRRVSGSGRCPQPSVCTLSG
jgi:acetyl-CoA carboxylase biotin carboxylase subunit